MKMRYSQTIFRVKMKIAYSKFNSSFRMRYIITKELILMKTLENLNFNKKEVIRP